jgi:hypothetical protein
MMLNKLLQNKTIKAIILFTLALISYSFIIENFASVGTELWQSTRMTRNMSYDLRGDPAPNPYNPFISPWNISTIPSIDNRLVRSRSPLANTSFLTPREFMTHSRGLSIGPDKTIKKGYLKGWPAIGHEPAVWINPVLLNMNKRWGWYGLF